MEELRATQTQHINPSLYCAQRAAAGFPLAVSNNTIPSLRILGLLLCHVSVSLPHCHSRVFSAASCKVSLLSEFFCIYVRKERDLERSSPECYKSLISGWWGFYTVWILVFLTGIRISVLARWLLPLSPPASRSSAGGTHPSYTHTFLPLLLYSEPVLLVLRISQCHFSGFLPNKLCFSAFIFPTECAAFHKLSLRWLFVLIPLLDCKLQESREWVLLILFHVWL